MEVDPDCSETQILRQKAENLQALTTGAFSSSVSKLVGSSRGLPTEKDFHFYYLFDEFKSPLDDIAAASQAMLKKIGSCGQFWPSENTYPADDMDDGYSWLVNVNDDVLERFDASIDELSRTINAQGKSGSLGKEDVDEDGFQLVSRKKKPFLGGICGGSGSGTESREKEATLVSPPTVRVAEKNKKVTGTKPKVPFHIPSIRRPQDDYDILVDNSNKPFEHVWLQRSEDGSKIIHPLEELSVSDFVDRKSVEPVKPPLLEATPFKFVQSVEELKEMVAKLREVDEFAVDLEHNQYRSFQGLTCLMQISTRTEDFIVDTLKLRVFVGPYLRELFKDPNKKKVMHGADRDVTWLQRDFGIYICNLFDTGQASRVLKLERNSLEYLLHHFCGVTANKEYQNAEWRLRPLPLEMIRYAREDTHYLLYIHDLMRVRLLSESTENGNSLSLLAEVYQRSYDVCMQLYEKELLRETSYLHLYGLQAANFNAQQLAIVSGLYEWRDIVARAEDEGTGYILPNKALLEIAKQMPVTTGKLRRLVRHKNLYIERNLSSVVNIIRHSIQHSSQFEAVVEQLREARAEVAPESIEVGAESSQVSHPPETCQTQTTDDNSALDETSSVIEAEKVGSQTTDESAPRGSLSQSLKQNAALGETSSVIQAEKVGSQTADESAPRGSPSQSLKQNAVIGNDFSAPKLSFSQSEKSTGATVQILKRPSPMLGALFGNLTSAKRVDYSKKDKEILKLEQIKSSVDLPFHSFKGGEVQKAKQATKEEPIKTPSSPPITVKESTDERAVTSDEESVIPLGEESSSSDEETLPSKSEGKKANPESMEEELSGQLSLADLSSSFKKCLDSMNQKQPVPEHTKQSKGSQGVTQLKPFDYEAAREEMESWGSAKEKGTETSSKLDNSGEVRIQSRVKERGKGGSSSSTAAAAAAALRGEEDDGAGLLPQGRRRQVFPASGNRSATFR